MSFKDYLKEKSDEQLKQAFGNVLGMSAQYKNAKPFEGSENLKGTFGAIAFNLLKEIEKKNKVKITAVDIGKWDFVILVDGNPTFDSRISGSIEKPIKYSGGGSANNIASVIKGKMPNLDIKVQDEKYFKVYKKHEKKK